MELGVSRPAPLGAEKSPARLLQSLEKIHQGLPFFPGQVGVTGHLGPGMDLPGLGEQGPKLDRGEAVAGPIQGGGELPAPALREWQAKQPRRPANSGAEGSRAEEAAPARSSPTALP